LEETGNGREFPEFEVRKRNKYYEMVLMIFEGSNCVAHRPRLT
jgi:hypothetical protein